MGQTSLAPRTSVKTDILDKTEKQLESMELGLFHSGASTRGKSHKSSFTIVYSH